MDSTRSTLARRRQAHPRSFAPARLILLIALVATSLFLAFFVLTLKPRAVSCITTENTYCSQAWVDELQTVRNASFWRVRSQEVELTSILAEKFPEVMTVSIARTLSFSVVVTVEQAKALFPVSIDGQTYEVRENGLVTPRTLDQTLIPVLETEGNVSENRLNTQIWTKARLENVAILLEQSEFLPKRIRKMTIHEPYKIVITPENAGDILISVDSAEHLNEQLATLQAFFRSSTMGSTYRELDLRFAQLVVKE